VVRTGSVIVILGLTVVAAAGILASRSQPVAVGDAQRNHRSRMLELGGRRTEIVEWGSTGPDIVMIHGANESPHMFDTFAPRFASWYHVVAYARRGHGKATPPAAPFVLDDLVDDLRIVMDSLGIEHAILMGHSFAGNEITRFAVLHPGRVDGLVYLDAQFETVENPYFMQAMGSMPIPPCAGTMKTRADFRACIADYLMPPIAWSPAATPRSVTPPS
jgi:pimeloyl-ACP methyl ester carboxylesterase